MRRGAMDYVIRGREGDIVPISVTADAGEVDACLRNFYLVMAQSAGLAPEAGKSARDVVVDALGADAVGEAASETVVRQMAPLVLDAAGIDAVGAPSFGCYGYAREGAPFSFDMRVFPKPQIKLVSYDPVELPARGADVAEADVDAFLDRVARYHPDVVVDEAAVEVAADSVVSLAMETLRDGERFEPLCFDEKEYRVGKGDMPDGFDEQLVGARLGQTLSIAYEAEGVDRAPDGTLPVHAYRSDVTVRAIMKLSAPVIDDAWVMRNISGCVTVGELRAKAREELAAQRTSETAEYDRYLAACAVADRLEGSVPDEAFRAAYAEVLDEFRSMLVRTGATEEGYLRDNGMSAEQLRRTMMSQARERLRQGLALDAVARHEGMKVTKADFKAYLDATYGGQGEEMLGNLAKRGGMRAAQEAALRAKANAWLVETARRA